MPPSSSSCGPLATSPKLPNAPPRPRPWRPRLPGDSPRHCHNRRDCQNCHNCHNCSMLWPCSDFSFQFLTIDEERRSRGRLRSTSCFYGLVVKSCSYSRPKRRLLDFNLGIGNGKLESLLEFG